MIEDAPALVEYLNGQREAGRIRCWGITGEAVNLPRILQHIGGSTPLVQFRDDIFDLPVRSGTDLPAARITYGALRRALPRFRWYVKEFPQEAESWSDRLGIDLRGDVGLPKLLLRQALDRNPAGVVLTTTIRPDRIKEAMDAVDEQSTPPDRSLSATMRDFANLVHVRSRASGPNL
jgi:hypothetical protein